MFEVGDLVVEKETILSYHIIGIIIDVQKEEFNMHYNRYDTLVTVMWMDRTTETIETKFLLKLGE